MRVSLSFTFSRTSSSYTQVISFAGRVLFWRIRFLIIAPSGHPLTLKSSATLTLQGSIFLAAPIDENTCPWQREATAIWGDDFATSVRGSDDDLLMLMRRFDDPALPRPRLYAACGTEDGLYGSNLVFKEAVEKTELEFRFEASPGIHNWVFWDRNVVPALDFFLERKLK